MLVTSPDKMGGMHQEGNLALKTCVKSKKDHVILCGDSEQAAAKEQQQSALYQVIVSKETAHLEGLVLHSECYT